MSIETNARVRDIPVYPAAQTYAFDGELVKLASNAVSYTHLTLPTTERV